MERKLTDYLPDTLRGYREFAAIADGQQWLYDGLWEAVDRALDDQFVPSAGEYGLSRWESILGIYAKGTDTAEERRTRILLRLSEQLRACGGIQQRLALAVHLVVLFAEQHRAYFFGYYGAAGLSQEQSLLPRLLEITAQPLDLSGLAYALATFERDKTSFHNPSSRAMRTILL